MQHGPNLHRHVSYYCSTPGIRHHCVALLQSLVTTPESKSLFKVSAYSFLVPMPIVAAYKIDTRTKEKVLTEYMRSLLELYLRCETDLLTRIFPT